MLEQIRLQALYRNAVANSSNIKNIPACSPPSSASRTFQQNFAMPLYQLLIYGACDHLRYRILIASATWDLCLSWSPPVREIFVVFSWSPPLRGTFVASVGRFRYMGLLLPELVASAMGPLSPELVASVGRLRYGTLVAAALRGIYTAPQYPTHA